MFQMCCGLSKLYEDWTTVDVVWSKYIFVQSTKNVLYVVGHCYGSLRKTLKFNIFKFWENKQILSQFADPVDAAEIQTK